MEPKELNWIEFDTLVLGHIRNYAIPQYGPDVRQSVDLTDAEKCLGYAAKYLARTRTGRRGRLESLRDLLKIAHCAQLAFDYMEPTEEEKKILFDGGVKE